MAEVFIHGPASADAYSEEGVDLTLIRSTLAMTPLMRLRALEGLVRSIEELRRAAARNT